MVKAEWGTKRTCPKCGVRFYDLGQDEPVTCIACHHEWTPEPILKSKQPATFETAPTAQNDAKDDSDDIDADDIDLDDDADAVDDDDDDDVADIGAVVSKEDEDET